MNQYRPLNVGYLDMIFSHLIQIQIKEKLKQLRFQKIQCEEHFGGFKNIRQKCKWHEPLWCHSQPISPTVYFEKRSKFGLLYFNHMLLVLGKNCKEESGSSCTNYHINPKGMILKAVRLSSWCWQP